jgi:hypothetical protein
MPILREEIGTTGVHASAPHRKSGVVMNFVLNLSVHVLEG